MLSDRSLALREDSFVDLTVESFTENNFKKYLLQ